MQTPVFNQVFCSEVRVCILWVYYDISYVSIFSRVVEHVCLISSKSIVIPENICTTFVVLVWDFFVIFCCCIPSSTPSFAVISSSHCPFLFVAITMQLFVFSNSYAICEIYAVNKKISVVERRFSAAKCFGLGASHRHLFEYLFALQPWLSCHNGL